ncbi:hypothetical protein C4546_02195 [Candidatus Parcubacteria bacterium]|jgi:hypothetical protein|nr:MAG: hypothetical protein C4546_02195 [Candidatus Parcubacteria bacterium]
MQPFENAPTVEKPEANIDQTLNYQNLVDALIEAKTGQLLLLTEKAELEKNPKTPDAEWQEFYSREELADAEVSQKHEALTDFEADYDGSKLTHAEINSAAKKRAEDIFYSRKRAA